MGRAEAVRTFLKWISGETSPTIYVSFWKKKRENLRGPEDRASPDCCMQWPIRSIRLFLPVAAVNRFGRGVAGPDRSRCVASVPKEAAVQPAWRAPPFECPP